MALDLSFEQIPDLSWQRELQNDEVMIIENDPIQLPKDNQLKIEAGLKKWFFKDCISK